MASNATVIQSGFAPDAASPRSENAPASLTASNGSPAE